MVQIPVEKSTEYDYEVVKVPQDAYLAKVKDEGRSFEWTDKEGKLVNSIAIPFEIQEGEYKGKVIDGIASLRVTEKTKLGKWAKELGCQVPEIGQNFDTKELIGKSAKIIVKNRKKIIKDEQVEVSYVDDVLSIKLQTADEPTVV